MASQHQSSSRGQTPSQADNLSYQACDAAGQAQAKKDGTTSDGTVNAYTAQATNFLQQTGEQVKNMAQGAAEAVKNTLGMNNDNANTAAPGSTTTMGSATGNTTTMGSATGNTTTMGSATGNTTTAATTRTCDHPNNPANKI